MAQSSSRKLLIKVTLLITAITLLVLVAPLGIAEAFYMLGRIHHRRLDARRAVDAYSSAIAIRPRGPMYLARADGLHTLGRFGDATHDYDEALRLGAPHLTVFRKRGNAKLLLGDLNGAIDDWSAAIAIAPREPDSYEGRGIARFRKGDARGALEDYTISLSLSPRPFHITYAHRAETRLALGDWDGAIEDATTCLKMNSHVDDAYIVRGRAWEAKGDLDAALRDYTTAINLVTLEVLPYLYRCDAYLRKGDSGAALEDAEIVVRRDPKLPEGLFSRARARAAGGDPQGAVADLHMALTLAPAGWVHRGAVTTLLKELAP